jgi:ubiquinol-cytochrome c reductase cytochrome b subunit
MEKAPPPLPPRPAIQPKAPSPLPQTTQAAFAVESRVEKPLAPQQMQKVKPSLDSPQNTKSSTLRSGGQTDSSASQKARTSQEIVSSAEMDDLDKSRDTHAG